MENLILDMGVFSWQNVTYTIQFILTMKKNSCCQEDALLLNFSVEGADN